MQVSTIIRFFFGLFNTKQCLAKLSLPPLFDVAVVYIEKDKAKSLANINPGNVVADTSSLHRTRARSARCFSRDSNASSEKIN